MRFMLLQNYGGIESDCAPMYEWTPEEVAAHVQFQVALYDLLERRNDNPVVRLNRAVAVAMVCGPDAALVILDEIADTNGAPRSHRVHAVRAHLLEMKGESKAAKSEYAAAAAGSANMRERDYLIMKAAALDA